MRFVKSTCRIVTFSLCVKHFRRKVWIPNMVECLPSSQCLNRLLTLTYLPLRRDGALQLEAVFRSLDILQDWELIISLGHIVVPLTNLTHLLQIC